MGLEEKEGSTGGRKAEYHTRIGLVLWECGQTLRRGHIKRSTIEPGMSLVDWTWRSLGRSEVSLLPLDVPTGHTSFL